MQDHGKSMTQSLSPWQIYLLDRTNLNKFELNQVQICILSINI